MKDMFGNEITEDEAQRKVKARDPQPQGYAALPGTGPDGETCGSCRHLARVQHAKTYLKCGLMRAYWTRGTRTDVRAKAPACRRWEKEEE